MPKKKIEKPQREMTHRQLSHWQKQKRLQNIVFIVGVVLIAAVLILIGTGVYLTKIKPAQELAKKLKTVVLTVDNATNYDLDYLTDAMSVLIKTYQNLGLSPSLDYLSTYANGAIQSTEGNFLIVEGAANLKVPDTVSSEVAAQIKVPVIVSDDEVAKYLKDNDLPDKQYTKDSARRQLLIDKLKSDYFNPQVPVTAEHREVWAMLLESQAQADQIKARIDNGDNKTEIAGDLSLDSTTKNKNGDLGWLPKGILASILGNIDPSNVSLLEDKIFSPDTVEDNTTIFDDPTLSKNMGYWLVKVAETTDEDSKAHVYAMLLGSQQQADDIKAKLAEGGEGNDWDTLTKANSQDSSSASSGGDLGLKGKGELDTVLDGAIFDENGKVILALDTVTGPLADSSRSTTGAAWLFEVQGIDQQYTTTEGHRAILVQNLFIDWFDQYTQENESRFTNNFDADLQQFAYNEALKR